MSWKDEMKSYTESEFLSSKDLVNGITKTKIKGFTKTEFKEEERYVLSLEGLKPLLLNKTNARVLLELSEQKNIEELAGHTVSLMKQKVVFQGDMVDAVRVIDLE